MPQYEIVSRHGERYAYTMTHPELSVVLLCYREGERIRTVVSTLIEILDKERCSYELILVANYDPNVTDATPSIAKAVAQGNSRIIVLADPKKPHQRFGWDVRQGLSRATGDIMAIVEGDTQTPLSVIPSLYRTMKEGHYDLGKVLRSHRYNTWMRWMFSHGYNLICSVVWPGLADKDINGKPKLITRGAYTELKLHSDDWFIDTEIMVHAREHRWRVLSLPVSWEPNSYRPSHVTAQTVWEFLKNIFFWRSHQ